MEFLEILEHSILITSFTLAMMLIIEFVNVQTQGAFTQKLQSKPILQIVLSTLLGMVPGCIGTFTVVSLYTHNIVRLGALVAALISASGDEAFFMFALIPQTAIKLNVLLFVIAIVAGIVTELLMKNRHRSNAVQHFAVHHHEGSLAQISFKSISNQLRNITFHRALLIIGLLLFIFSLVSGHLDDSHAHHTEGGQSISEHIEHTLSLDWVNTIFIIVSVVALVIVVSVDNHFLVAHLWQHVIKKHLLKLFLWTVGALTITAVLMQFIDLQLWVQNNVWLVLIIAVLVGIIPESGPHMIFLSMFVAGTMPFGILLANSIVQDGHGALPLLAESKRSFLIAKGVNVVIALLVGSVSLLLR